MVLHPDACNNSFLPVRRVMPAMLSSRQEEYSSGFAAESTFPANSLPISYILATYIDGVGQMPAGTSGMQEPSMCRIATIWFGFEAVAGGCRAGARVPWAAYAVSQPRR